MFATRPPPAAIDFHLNTSTTTSPLHYQDYNANAYAPSRPSPLAMSQFSFATPQHHHQHQYNQCPASSQPSTSTTPPNRTNYAQRYATTIANPLSSVISPNTPITTTNNYSNATRATRTSGGTSPTARAHRRTLFLNRIKQDRDAGRFEARGEQLVLMEDAAEEKRRRESMGRRAERIMKGFGIGEGEDENEMKMDGGMFFFFPFPLCPFVLSAFLKC